MVWEESSMSFFICTAEFLCRLYRIRIWVSQIAADEDTELQSVKDRRKESFS